MRTLSFCCEQGLERNKQENNEDEQQQIKYSEKCQHQIYFVFPQISMHTMHALSSDHLSEEAVSPQVAHHMLPLMTWLQALTTPAIAHRQSFRVHERCGTGKAGRTVFSTRSDPAHKKGKQQINHGHPTMEGKDIH